MVPPAGLLEGRKRTEILISVQPGVIVSFRAAPGDVDRCVAERRNYIASRFYPACSTAKSWADFNQQTDTRSRKFGVGRFVQEAFAKLHRRPRGRALDEPIPDKSFTTQLCRYGMVLSMGKSCPLPVLCHRVEVFRVACVVALPARHYQIGQAVPAAIGFTNNMLPRRAHRTVMRWNTVTRPLAPMAFQSITRNKLQQLRVRPLSCARWKAHDILRSWFLRCRFKLRGNRTLVSGYFHSLSREWTPVNEMAVVLLVERRAP